MQHTGEIYFNVIDWVCRESQAAGMSLNLSKLSSSSAISSGPVVLVVMDGIGLGREDAGNAVHLARTPFLDHALQTMPSSRLVAHGTAVGLPTDADMGNSEVGHNALGAGRIFSQGATRVDEAIKTGDIANSPVWSWLMESDVLHFIGLLSDGNVHSHEDHLHALLRLAAAAGKTVVVHPLLDGRDVPDGTALEYIDRLEGLLADLGHGAHIASGGGRMFVTMDRYEADWSVVERGWNAHVHGQARRFRSAREAIETFRGENPDQSDQYLPPFSIDGAQRIEDGDAVILFNFRGDRAIELTCAFESDEFDGFDRGRRPDVRFAGMMQYDGDLQLPQRFLVDPPSIDRTLGEHLAHNGVRQWACSETQKFGHVTYFWNGNRSGAFDPSRETYLEVPSGTLPFEERPWMRCAEITDRTIEAVKSGEYEHLRLNYANGDMVGHTGDLEATIVAVEAVDLCLRRLAPVVQRAGGILLVTADHGNADEMIRRDGTGRLRYDGDGHPARSTSHSLAPVPFVMCGAPDRVRLAATGRLSNVAGTVLELLGYAQPDDYERSLLRYD